MSQRYPYIAPFEHQPRYRAPGEHGATLVAPPLWSQADRGAMRAWSRSPALDGLSFGGLSLSDLRRVARRDALAAAIDHTQSYRGLWFDRTELLQSSDDSPWIVAGHQPELFHPGVWFKNFLLSQAAPALGNAIPLNLVIDNDLCRSPGIRVPTRDDRQSRDWRTFRTENILFDAPAPAVAWECRPVMDMSLLSSFPERVKQSLVSEVASPLVDHLWPHAIEAARRTGRLGLAIAEARHALEGELGLRTLELPLGQLCQQSSFARFSLSLLSQLPRFQSIYNAQRTAYRTANGIRSESHPVPELTIKHGWFEAPWWVYRQAAPTRRRLFVRLEAGDLILSDQAGWQATVEGPLDSEDAIADWQQFAIDGVMLRPRALVTTMFVRLVISDLFMHGIGGGKYDQMTDAIIREFFAIAPPPMCVATATLRLPIARDGLSTSAELKSTAERLQKTIRDLRHQPEEHLESPDAETIELLKRKRELLENIPPRGQKWEWHHQITQVNKRLAALNAEAVQRTAQRLQDLGLEERQLKLIQSREYSFCLFDLPTLARSLTTMAQSALTPPPGK